MVNWDSLLTSKKNVNLFKRFAFDEGISIEKLRSTFKPGTEERTEVNTLLRGNSKRARKMAQMALNRRRNKGVLTY